MVAPNHYVKHHICSKKVRITSIGTSCTACKRKANVQDNPVSVVRNRDTHHHIHHNHHIHHIHLTSSQVLSGIETRIITFITIVTIIIFITFISLHHIHLTSSPSLKPFFTYIIPFPVNAYWQESPPLKICQTSPLIKIPTNIRAHLNLTIAWNGSQIWTSLSSSNQRC